MERASAFTQEELNVFAIVAAQAGAAIDNAVSHQRIAQQSLQRSALERFLSPEVAAMVVANPDIKLGGVSQEVTVLFADIRGFTAMSENMEASRVVEILNEYFTRVTDVIFDHGGTLDKYMGDAVMAVFGAPISKGNDAANAVTSAIQIQRLLVELNHDAAARQWPELRVGIGINTGSVIAGNIGSPRRLDYTVVGDTVNTASRLMSNAEGGQILVSESTATAIGEGFDQTRLPALKVKGRVEPVQDVFVVAINLGQCRKEIAKVDFSAAHTAGNQIESVYADSKRRHESALLAQLALRARTISAAHLQAARDRLGMPLARIEKTLQSESWLAGPSFSVADIDAYPMLCVLPDLAPELMNAAVTPRIADYLERIAARDSVRAALRHARTPHPEQQFVPGVEASRWG